MAGVTNDEVVNALVDLGVQIVERQRSYGGHSTRPSMTGDDALGVLANALLHVAERLQRGEYGP